MSVLINVGNPIRLSDLEFAKLSRYIRDNYGINLPITKRVLLESRLQKHLRISGIPSFKKYIEQVCEGEEHEEVIKMINLVSTNKTDFFRERSHFDFMTSSVLPAFINEKKRDLNIWCAAASTGEEIYTIAMTIEEFFLKNKEKFSYSITGTDISTDALHLARSAIYQESNISGIPIELRKRYFLKSKDRSVRKVRVSKQLRDRSKFKRFNLMESKYPNPAAFDIIFCRNVLIYFDKATQESVLKKLCGCLKVGGYLFLGHAESLLTMKLPLKQRLHAGYEKIPAS